MTTVSNVKVWCGECGLVHPRGSHLPLFHIKSEEWGVSDDLSRGIDHETAAAKWAEQWDVGDYTIVGKGNTPEVDVTDEHGVTKKIRVHGESVPRYYAREVK